ncbi:MraY family glycosyltransferase [Sandaracinus amylolyticus]|uniref:MraY family glycosyltransferase n=1 Tax=Sandaracinus amylolyticus TaxID=927083 RepID=UPI001F223B20|nr:MraY family glycosyltransferase [Sandaracinus amylolyticus]UJR80408.1 Undecaprenyl-phosphate alpha-N-acetylglucosaminyl 1-phosphate transferase [Sandaracinus amylolyticus]
MAGYVTALGCVAAWDAHEGRAFAGAPTPIVGFLVGGLLLAGVGAVDDVRALGAKKKLAFQSVAASIAWAAGARIEAFDLPWIGSFEFAPVASYVMSVGWILAFVNAINLIDGLDGLASGMVFFAAITNTIVALTTENHLAAVLNVALGASVLAFLYYNFNPATVFLGDTGSMFLGYVLGASALLSGRQKESTVVALLVPVVALGVPLTDTLFTMLRRFLERRPIFSADRGHIHHRLLDLGFTHRRVVLLLYAISVLTCVAAIAAAFGKDWQVGLALLAAVLVVLASARFAGYFRLRVVREASSDVAKSQVRNRIALALAGSHTTASEYLSRIATVVLEVDGFVKCELVRDEQVLWSWQDSHEKVAHPNSYEYVWNVDELTWRLRFFVDPDLASSSTEIEPLLQLTGEVAAHILARDTSWRAMVRESRPSLQAAPLVTAAQRDGEPLGASSGADA